MRELGEVESEASKPPAAEATVRSSLAIFESPTPSNPGEMSHVLNNLALVLQEGAHGKLNNSSTAERVMRDVLRERQKILGEHPQVYRSMQRMAHVLFLKGSYGEAETLFRQALEEFRRMLGALPRTCNKRNLAALLKETGRLDEAEKLYREAIATGERTLGSKQAYVSVWQANLAKLAHAKR